jgi:hypothetical protein
MIGPLISTLVFKDVMFSDPTSLLRMVAARTRPGLNDTTSTPRRLMIVEIQGGKNMGINSWHEQQIDEMMMREDEQLQSEEVERVPSSEAGIEPTQVKEDELD